MRLILSLIAVLFLTNGIAQQVYRDSVYSYKKVKSETGSFVLSTKEELGFDYYRHKDAKGKLPLIVCVHGGGFQTGKRDSKGMIYFCKRMASRGYAAMSVSYRLTMKDIGFDCDITPEMKQAAIDSAASDVLMAIKKVIKNNATYKIDPEKIILLGTSAGAETVLNLAYNSHFDEVKNDIKFAGVVSLAGAITDINSITSENAIPTQMIHGTGDPLVPYHVAAHHYCNDKETDALTFYGPAFIAPRLKGMNASYYLLSVVGGTHSWAGKGFSYCFNDIVDFLYHDVVAPTATRQTEQSIIFNDVID
jgi:acetyl esterase/lipase